MHPEPNSFSYKSSISAGFPRISGNLEIPAKRLGFPRHHLVPWKDASPSTIAHSTYCITKCVALSHESAQVLVLAVDVVFDQVCYAHVCVRVWCACNSIFKVFQYECVCVFPPFSFFSPHPPHVITYSMYDCASAPRGTVISAPSTATARELWYVTAPHVVYTEAPATDCFHTSN